MESGNITLKYLQERSTPDNDRFNVVISWHIIASACFLSSFTKQRQRLLCHLHFFESKCHLDLTCRLQSSFSPWAQEKSCSYVEKKGYISPSFDFPKQGNMSCNIPEISEKTFLVDVDQLNYHCHLSQYASWQKKIHCHVANDLEIPSLILSQELSWYWSEKIHICLNKCICADLLLFVYICSAVGDKPVYPCHSFCACPKPGPGFTTPYVIVFVVFNGPR